jgi:predicted AAA+ superfamily ATPase
MTRITELDQLDVLVALLGTSSGSTLSYSSLARAVNVSVDTIRRWVTTLTTLHHGFLVRPWFRNVRKSLRKEPKWYVRDWSEVTDHGARLETFVACHLLKAVQAWEDLGFGRYELRYLRDLDKREVDFAVVRDGKPWFLVEVKAADTTLSPHLRHFQAQTAAEHAFQAVLDMAHVQATPFRSGMPTVVPLRTLLSQLP